MAKAKKTPQQKQEANRFSKARLSRSQNTREKVAQEKARERMKKKRRQLEQKAERLTIPVFLRKFSELLMFSALIGAVITYNLDIPQESLNALLDFIRSRNEGRIPIGGDPLYLHFLADLRFVFSGGLPVLESKTTIFLFFGVMCIFTHFSARVYEALMKDRVYALDPNAENKGTDHRRLFVMCAAITFMIWSLISFSDIGWGPKFSPLADTGGEEAAIGSAGSYSAFVAWIQVFLGVIFLIAVEDMIRTRRLVYKILGLIFGLGIFACLFSLTLQLDFKPITQFLVDWGDQEYRNDVGGIIGHNTAISSYLIAPFIIGWTYFLMQKDHKSWKSIGLILCLALMGLILLMAQSRAVIPILFVCLAWGTYLLVRRAGIKIPMPIVVGTPLIILLLILSQVVSSNINPFYRDSVTLNQRVSHLTFEHLQTETRFRIFAATFPKVAENALVGTGFHSFPYVYTDAQSEYFAQDKDFFFAPTSKRTARAHNEYLQTLLETGVVGLALALIAVGGILLAGWRILTRSLRQRHVGIQVAIITSVLGYLLHCFFDFPLRIAPLYSVIIMMLAIWSAGDRLWNIKVPPLEDRPMNDEEAEKKLVQMIKEEKNRTINPTLLAVWTVIATAASVVVVYISIIGMTWFVNPLLTLRGNQLIAGYASTQDGTTDQRISFLIKAKDTVENAHRVAPLAGETIYLLAQINQFIAVEYSKSYQQFAQAGDMKAANFAREKTKIHVRQGVDRLKRSLTEHYFFGSYRLLALLHFCDYLVDNQNKQAMAQAIETMEQAIELNPGDYNSLSTLIDWKNTITPGDVDGIARLYKKQSTFSPGFVERDVFPFINQMISAGEYERAYRQVLILNEAFPDNVDYKLLMIFVGTVTGNVNVARELNETLPAVQNPNRRLFQAQISIKRGEYQAALEELLIIKRTFEPEVEKRKNLCRILVEAKLRSMSITEAQDASSIDANMFAKLASEEITSTGDYDKQDLLEAAKIVESLFDDQEGAFQVYLVAKSLDGELKDNNQMYFGRLIMERYDRLIENVSKEQSFAASQGTPREEWPKIEDEIARAELIEAINLLADAYETMVKLEQKSADEMADLIRKRLFKLKSVLAPDK